MEERTRILSMLKNGKISEKEAERLLDAIGDNANKFSETKAASKIDVKNLVGKLCIEVNSADGDDVMVKIPLKLAPLGLKMMPKQTYEQMKKDHGIDLAELLTHIDEIAGELDEDIVNVNSANGDKVRIYVKK
ncbi:MAG: hypothetical protein A2504_08860 [Bdellovibrionales bacterium RIFOXYD12_FULL_39_22]|nr:MAG: hypothetical protein A2385_13375 [Bdellovibrionales bacterium RIFOXYB1_FULL_39_21]OFZ40919.1 MAG: hypothetical protein A2485_16370 [Bdellovibrionales bacterium RIFOXYC12_FULL_39_17]OFZ44737.1 MAG: hypothetical protein A2404_10750 [Bdellovibrionales bacterium RIFOXYC1_FULL_39_130]OFZ69674.1 MAG: hypothetical protein A2451_12510 [Bdellovibrionales bacterium RIFOXYC2_FULL_39_8]OFZ74188.1 MAG: hypothetical protein A2560_03415 [Bdellovibrionales bacterium RIFOXYD1_FULL_39_84]OFZ92068.1 MAG: